ncbi:MAG: hypothetical protein K2O34_01405, partial [Acetatifactor sp.]|nr:hypothetical protein [Acetatifactor sp.]
MKEEFRKKLAGAARKGRRVAIAATAGAVVLGSISYTKAAGIEDVFDEHYYADMYPDLKDAYGYDREALLEHFKTIGIYEGRTMNEMIDIVKYREQYQDLQDAFGDDWDAYVAHYLSCGAFEHRDSGTDFDPVAYLERYGDLQEVFGDDVLAAYRHYEECGKQEGREARSDAAVKAGEGALKHGNTEESSKPAEEPSKPVQEAFKIQNVEVMGSGRIRVTLNRKTEQPLALAAFSIICNSGGSDMTILSASTEDNMVYDLSTAYYRDQEYDIQITLADGTSISKVFAYRTDCAQIAGINAVRTGANEATITYNSDEPGYFYYILRENGLSQMRSAAFLADSTETVPPTEAEIIRDGIRTEMKQHQNVFTVTGLTEGMSYTMYYVAVNTEEKSTLVNSLTIEENVHEETAAAIKGAKAFAEKQENGEILYGFEIELETATPESLTLGQFDISCPLNETTLGSVKTSDNKTYRVYMQRGSIPKGNNTYTILINMKDGTQLKGTCYLDLQAPRVSIRSIEWTDKDTVRITVNSDEAGDLYYAILDNVEGEGTIAAKDPTQIYANGTKVSIGYGLNYITVKGAAAGQWFCCASEDAQGNREDFYSYKEIPVYTAPDQEQPTLPQITGLTVVSDTQLKVVFDNSVYGFYENSLTQISGLGGRPMLQASYESEGDMEDNVVIITIMNGISIPE